MPQQRVGWQPSRFLADRAEAERAFQLAEQLGSVNAPAAELGTTRPSLRKAFTRHGLGMPARNPEAVRQRAVAAARQRSGQPATPPLDPVFVALNPAALPARERSPAELHQWVRRDEEYTTPGANVVVELNSESHCKSTTRAWAIIRRADHARRLAGQRIGRPERRQAERASRPDRPHQPHDRGWLPMPPDPTYPDQLGSEARFRADLVACLDSLFLHDWPTCWGRYPSRPEWHCCTGCRSAARPGPGRRRTGRSCRRSAAACGTWWPSGAPPAGQPPRSGCAAGRPIRARDRPGRAPAAPGPGGRPPPRSRERRGQDRSHGRDHH
jgi:hypothetical protein